MSCVEDIRENYEEQKIINTILWFIIGVLFLIPSLEEGAEALELRTLVASLRLIRTTSDVGVSVYNVSDYSRGHKSWGCTKRSCWSIEYHDYGRETKAYE
jgi:hypothetical protein